MALHAFADDLSVVVAGEAGQGIQTIEQILDHLLGKQGYYLFSTGELMSRIRGGCNSTQIRVASRPISAYVNRIDICVPLDSNAIPHLAHRITGNTVIIGDAKKISTDRPMIDIPFSEIAAESGGRLYENTVAAGTILGLLGISQESVDAFLKSFFGSKSDDIVAKNIKAATEGLIRGKKLIEDGTLDISIKTSETASEQLLFSGVDAVSFGAIAGGCNFVSSYPMSPATGVLTFLARQGKEFGIVVEQCEDEIAAMNMILGAWYAGARGFTTTAGGGFALMCEAVSLCGMIETPAVVHVGQRPGPATGLPTRTEQSDLELVLYAGHGEFPRVIYAPGTLDEAFTLTQQAFNIADKHQIPAFILTDQFLLDSYAMTRPFNIQETSIEQHIVQTTPDYKRYALTPSGISPRGIPGYGEGIVAVDSDEHTEAGYITESAAVRVSMVEKRLRKAEGILEDVVDPVFEGPRSYKTIVVCWGSTFGALREAISLIDAPIALLHFPQVFPVSPSAAAFIKPAKKKIIVEGNATGQFAKLLKLHAGIEFDSQILKYDGNPFSVEELVSALSAEQAKGYKT